MLLFEWLSRPVAFWWTLVGFAIGIVIAVGLIWRGPRSTRNATRSGAIHFICAGILPLGAAAAMLIGLLAATGHVGSSPSGEMKVVEGAFMLLAGVLSATMIFLAGRLAVNERTSIESKWGSLGGARSGYDVSRPVVLLAILAGCLLSLIALGYRGVVPRQDHDQKEQPLYPKGERK